MKLPRFCLLDIPLEKQSILFHLLYHHRDYMFCLVLFRFWLLHIHIFMDPTILALLCCVPKHECSVKKTVTFFVQLLCVVDPFFPISPMFPSFVF